MKALKLNLKVIITILITCITACIDTGLPSHSSNTDINITYSRNNSALFNVKFLTTTPESVLWDFGDGYQGSGYSINHKYLSPGSYQGNLTYEENGKKINHELAIIIEGDNQNITIKPKLNIIIDSDHNDPNQPYKENNTSPQLISSPLKLSGILIKKGACQAGNLCSKGDTLDWYSINLEHGDTIELEVIKGSLDLSLTDSKGQIIIEKDNINNNYRISTQLTGKGQFQLKMKLNLLSEKTQYIINAHQEIISESENYQPGKLIVQWENTQIPELIDISDPRLIPMINKGSIDLPATRNSLIEQTNIKSVSLNYYRHAFSSDVWQWPLIQQNINELWQPLSIQGEQPGQNTTVAILDTGLFFQHSNLNGIQTHSGYDFVSDPINSGDFDGWDQDPSDPGDENASYHGTHVTGIISAQPSNQSTSITGIAWAAQIMPLRVLGINGGTSYDLIQALRYAAGLTNDTHQLPSKPADIINLSLGGGEFSIAEQATINEVIQTGVIVVAATGNQGQNQINYPAGYKDVIAVGATDISGNVASYSNYGAFIDLVAPGGHCSNSMCSTGINSLSAIGKDQGQLDNRQSSWKRLSGTSMATAHVSALLAIARSRLPSLDSKKVEILIKNNTITSDLLDSGFDVKSGWGQLNSTKILNLMDSSDLDKPSLWTNQSDLFVDPNTTITLPIITRGNTENKEISADFDPDYLSVTLGKNEFTISTTPQFTTHKTIELYLESELTSTIHLYPKQNYKLPEYSQHLYLDFENSSVHSSGLRTVIDEDSWQANIPPLTPGQTIQASSDIDYDGVFCELGEFCAHSEYSGLGVSDVILNGSILER